VDEAARVSFLGDVVAWFTTPGRWSGPSGIPVRLWQHLFISAVSVLVALVLGLPVGVWLGHRRRFGTVAINVSNVGRAIPSFALLVLGAQIWGISEFVHGLPTAALLALVLLSLPPIVTNAYIGLANVDDGLRDAARGVGMTGAQSLWRAELPVAVPSIMNGIRIASLQVVATAGLAALVGAGGLGRYIVDGFAVRDLPRVFGGALLVAALALGIELLLGLVQRLVTPKGVRLAGRST
jgi:osmoprotectant transport system permease protein